MKEIKEVIKAIFEINNFSLSEENVSLILAISSLTLIIIPFISKLLTKIYYIYIDQFVLELQPYFSKDEIQNAIRNFIPTQCQNIAPSISDEPGQHHAFITKESLIPFFLDKAFKNYGQKFYLILADSGMGKTTFLINLYINFKRKNWILKSLKLMNKTKIFLFPLGNYKALEDIKEIKKEDKRNSILLLDAFDEDLKVIETNYIDRLDEIINVVWEFKKIVITCRTQFFPTQDQEPYDTGMLKFGGEKGKHVFGKLYVSPFDQKDIRKYLRKKYSFLQKRKRRKAFSIIRKANNLMIRPMLLNYIDAFVNEKHQYQWYSTSKLYEALIWKWIEREASRRIVDSDKFKENLYEFSRIVASFIYENRQHNGGLFIENSQINSFAKQYNIDLSNLEIRSRSLLNRTADGKYKFSHKSILEYFLALKVFEKEDLKKKFSFEGMDFAKMIYNDLTEQKFRNIFLKDREYSEIRLIDYIYIKDWNINFDEKEFIRAFPYMSVKNTERMKKRFELIKSEIQNLLTLKPIPKLIQTLILSTSWERIVLRETEFWSSSDYGNFVGPKNVLIRKKTKIDQELKWINFILPILENNKRNEERGRYF